jgi:hypothetical protein
MDIIQMALVYLTGAFTGVGVLARFARRSPVRFMEIHPATITAYSTVGAATTSLVLWSAAPLWAAALPPVAAAGYWFRANGPTED